MDCEAAVKMAAPKKAGANKNPARPQPASNANVPSLEEKVTKAVMAKVGDDVDGKLLETIIKRVLKSVGSK